MLRWWGGVVKKALPLYVMVLGLMLLLSRSLNLLLSRAWDLLLSRAWDLLLLGRLDVMSSKHLRPVLDGGLVQERSAVV